MSAEHSHSFQESVCILGPSNSVSVLAGEHKSKFVFGHLLARSMKREGTTQQSNRTSQFLNISVHASSRFSLFVWLLGLFGWILIFVFIVLFCFVLARGNQTVLVLQMNNEKNSHWIWNAIEGLLITIHKYDTEWISEWEEEEGSQKRSCLARGKVGKKIQNSCYLCGNSVSTLNEISNRQLMALRWCLFLLRPISLDWNTLVQYERHLNATVQLVFALLLLLMVLVM